MNKEGPLFDAARALRRAAGAIEDFAVVDAGATIDNCDSSMRIEAQKSRLRRAQAEIDAALARLAVYAE